MLAQSIAPVWYETHTDNFNVTDENRLPILRVQNPPASGPGSDNATTHTSIDVYSGLYRYDDTRLLLGIRSNGINEDDPGLSDSEKALAERFPDRSIEWINAETGEPMGTAFVVGWRPDIDIDSPDSVDLGGVLFTDEWLAHPDFNNVNPDADYPDDDDIDGDGEISPEENEIAAGANSSGGYYWQWGMDDSLEIGEVPAIYTGWGNKVLRFAPAEGATVENPSWSSTATVAYQEDTPGRGSGANNGDRWWQWRIINLHVLGHGEDTQILIHGETWRAGVHPQMIVTTDGKRFYKAATDVDGNVVKTGARVNNRSGGNLNGHSSGGGPTSPMNIKTMNAAGESVPADPSAPNLMSIYNGHYPNGNWNSGKTRYDHDPDNPAIHGGPGLESVPLFQGNNGARGSIPSWSYEQSAEPSGNDHSVSGVEVYDGFWANEFESSSDLDYIVVFNVPSWNNQHGGVHKPGWVGLHQLDGSQSSQEDKAFRIDTFDPTEATVGDTFNSTFFNTSAQLEVNPTGDGNAEVLWANGSYSFGRAQVTTHPVTAPTDGVAAAGSSQGETRQADPIRGSVAAEITLRAGGFGGSPLTLQWYKDGEPIPPFDAEGNPTGSMAWNQTHHSFTIPVPFESDSGDYKLRAWNKAGFMETAARALLIEPEMDPPTVVATSSLEGFSIGLLFNERVSAETAENPDNYDVRDGDGNSVIIDQAILRADGRSIQLFAADLATDTYSVTVSNVEDFSGNAIVSGAGDSADGVVQGFFAIDIAADPNQITAVGQTFTVAPNEFEVTTGHADIWNTADVFYYITEERTGDLDMKVQVTDASGNPGNSRNGLMARESVAAGSRHINYTTRFNASEWAHIRRETNGGTARWRADDQPADAPFPDSWVRLKRHANDWTAWRSTNGQDWEFIAEEKGFDLGPTVLFGIAQSHTGTSKYANYGTFEYPNAVIEITEHPADNVPDETTLEGYEGRTASFSASARALRDPENNFQTSIDGLQAGFDPEMTDTFPDGTGSGTLAFGSPFLHVDISYTGLESPISNAHVHGPAAPGANAGVLVPLMDIHEPAVDDDGNPIDTAGRFVGTIDLAGLSASVEDIQAAIRDGLAYVNIHTTANGGGEIRGQVVPEELDPNELGYQWRLNGTPLANKTGPTFTTDLLQRDDNGGEIDVVVSVSGADPVTSTTATLMVVPDEVAPNLTSLAALNGFQAGLCFDELLDLDSVANAVYTITDGEFFDATLRPDGMSIEMNILLNNINAETFTITVEGVTDLAGNTQTIEMTGPVHGLEVFQLGNNSGNAFSCWENTIEVTSAGGDIWGNSDNGIIVTELRDDDFDVRVQVDQLTGNSNRNGLMVRETTDADSRHLNMTSRELANGDDWAHIRRETGQATARIREDARGLGPYPDRWVRINRQGRNFTLWRSTDGESWEFFAREDNFDLGYPVEVGLNQNNSGTTLYHNYGDFSYADPRVEIVSAPPTLINAPESLNITLDVEAAAFNGDTALNANELAYQWFLDTVAIPGATGPSYTTPLLTLLNDGDTYTVEVSMTGASVTTDGTELNVDPDGIAPTIVGSGAAGNLNIGIIFSEFVNKESAENPANYTVEGGTVESATLVPDLEFPQTGDTVVLVVSGATGTEYSGTVSGVSDLAGTANIIADNSPFSGTISYPELTGMDLGDPIVPGLLYSSGAGNLSIQAGGRGVISNDGDQFTMAIEPVTGDFDKVVKITSIVASQTDDNWARGGIIAKDGGESVSRVVKVSAANPNGANTVQAWGRIVNHYPLEDESVTPSPYADFGYRVAGVADTLPNQWLRLKRVGNGFWAFVSDNGTDWALLSEKYSTDMAETLYVGLYASASVEGETVTVAFEDYGDWDSGDTTAPTLVSAGSLDGSIVGVKFSETVNAGSVVPGNFAIDGSIITGAEVGINGDSAYLHLETAVEGDFTVVVNGVTDSSGNAIASDSSVSGAVAGYESVDIGVFVDPDNRPTKGDDPAVVGKTVALSSGDHVELDMIGGGSNIWNPGDFEHYVYKPVEGDFDIMVENVRRDRSHGGGATFSHAGIQIRDMVFRDDVDANTADATKARVLMNTTYALTAVGRTAIVIWRNALGGGYGNSPIIGEGTVQPGTEVNGVRPGKISAGNAAGDAPANWSPEANRWLRVKRSGQEFTSYWRYFGDADWQEYNVHSFPEAMPDTVLVGLAEMTDTTALETSNYFTLTWRNFGPTADVGGGDPIPEVAISIQSGQVILQWDAALGDGYRLVEADEVDGPYTDSAATIEVVDGTVVVTISPSEARRFYQLVK